jgi:photosystem II stability/assembly factor-like uncharacterized protein
MFMKKILSVVIVCILTNIVFAQAVWGPPSSFGTSNYLPNTMNDVYYTSSSDVWVVGNQGIILKSVDAGQTWTEIPSGVLTNLFGINFSSATNGIIVGDLGTVLSTVDGGATWVSKNIQDVTLLFDAQILTPLDYIVVGQSGKIYKTTDGGDNWATIPSGYISSLNGIDFTSATHGLIVGDDGTILYTINGGSSWLPRLSGIFQKIYDIQYVSATEAWAVGQSGKIIVTTDGGATWAEQTSLTSADLFGLYMLDNLNGWAVGSSGTFLYTVDGGITWDGIDPGTTKDLKAIHFSSALDACLVGVSNYIAVTNDAGFVWDIRIESAIEVSGLRSTFFTPPANGWAVGDNGKIIYTTDGGFNWMEQNSGTNEILTSIFSIDGLNAWACGDNGTILKTTDGGVNWIDYSIVSGPIFNSIFFTSSNVGWIVGANGEIHKSIDGGVTWTLQSSGTFEILWDCYFLDDLTGWVAGSAGILLYTTDGGSTWTPQTTGTTEPLIGLTFISSTEGWAVGGLGTIIHTNDGGINWSSQVSGTLNNLRNITFISPLEGWALGFSGTLIRTTNGGATWVNQSPNATASLFDIRMFSSTSGILVGLQGTIRLYQCATPEPSGDVSQTFCYGSTISDLNVLGSTINWYENAIGGTPFTFGSIIHYLTDSESYFASQTIDGCESEDRFEVIVTIDNGPLAPTGDALQSFCFSATLADLSVNGTAIEWYDLAVGGNILTSETPLQDGVQYFAAQASSGCISQNRLAVEAEVLNQGNDIILTITPTDATCANNSGTASVNATGGTAPLNYLWDNGSQTSTTSNLSAGIHYINVTDNLGCAALASFVINTTSGPQITLDNLDDNLCAGDQNGSIAISVNGGQSPYTFQWNNNAVTEDISNLAYGCYEVLVTDFNGCQTADVYFINEPSPIFVNHQINSSTCLNADGAIQLVVGGGIAPYTYNWNNGATTQNITALESDVYEILVTDANGCEWESSYALNDVEGVLIQLDSIINDDCIASTGSIYIQTTGTNNSYLWSNNGTTEDLLNVAGGIYTIKVTSPDGCISNGVFSIKPNVTDNQTLCIITVDEASQNNVLVWEKEISTDISSYKIYRESCQLGVYHLIHTQSYSDESLFEDPLANAENRGWRYKISAVNNCGIESSLSDAHRAIHLMLTENAGTYSLVWTDYEGFSVTTHDVYRNSDQLGVELVTNAPQGTNSTTDTPPIVDNLTYFVIADLGYTCTSSRANINTSRSNTKGVAAPVDGIEEELARLISLQPNPTNGIVNIKVPAELLGQSMIFTNAVGQVLSTMTIHSINVDFDLSQMADGIYFVQVQTKGGVVTKKIVKQ